MDTVFLKSHNAEVRRILPWPNHPEHPTRWSLEKMDTEEVKARRVRDSLRADLARLGGWQDCKIDDPVVGELMGRVSAWNSLLDGISNARRFVSSLPNTASLPPEGRSAP